MRRPVPPHLVSGLIAGAALAAAAVAAHAAETLTYTYDARGRLIQVSHGGTVNDGLATYYTLDKAENRILKTEGIGAPPPTFPSFAIGDASATEPGNLIFTVTKSGTGYGDFSVSYATANGTATAGSDYTATSGSLTFTSSDVTKTITVNGIDDAVWEGTETFTVNLSNPTGGSTITDSQGVGTINDNETNAAPTPALDTTSATRCETKTVNVTSNDTDPDGDYPLTVTAASSASMSASPSPPASVTFTAPDAGGTFNITYTVKDSRNATANGTLRVTVSSTPLCP